MSIGNNIKKLRELKNYTQAHMAKELNLSLGAYGNIERDETDITITRLNQIAEILETSLATILNFDSNQVFNQYNNKTATANGIVQNQQIIADKGLEDVFSKINDDIKNIKITLDKIQNKK